MIDVVQQINAVQRRVGTKVLDKGEANTVVVSQTFDADIEDLWDACTNAERIPRWFLPISGDLRLGGRYQLEGNAGGVIETCDPPRAVSATWEFGGDVTWIEVRLTPVGSGRTRFELEHIALPSEHWRRFGPGAVGVGWDMGLIGLTLHLRSGESVDPKAFDAWSTSDDGRRFVTLSSQAWYDANVAAGTKPEEAHAMADNTAEAYGGAPS